MNVLPLPASVGANQGTSDLPLHEARYARDGAQRGASRRPIAGPMGKARNEVARHLARNPSGDRAIFAAGIVASSVVDRHPLGPSFAPAAKLAHGRAHAGVDQRFLSVPYALRSTARSGWPVTMQSIC